MLDAKLDEFHKDQAYSHSSNSTTHKNKTSSSASSSYDSGYEDYIDPGDYDEDKYFGDWNYRTGVDDAMDELGAW